MATQLTKLDLAPILASARRWIENCLIEDRSLFASDEIWSQPVVRQLHDAFVGHPDFGTDDFITKLKRQMRGTSIPAQRLMAEMLWALLIFPSNIKPATKRRQVHDIWELSGHHLDTHHALLRDDVLCGIGSGGPGFNNYRPDELAFLITLVGDLKAKDKIERQRIFGDYATFIAWIGSVQQRGHRQFRHMLRYLAFPDLVERMSSNNDRVKVLEAFGIAPQRQTRGWTDLQLDQALLALRRRLEAEHPSQLLDFYEMPLRERWSGDHKVNTPLGEIVVTVPEDDDEADDAVKAENDAMPTEPRQSIRIQASLAEIGAIMGFKIWVPRSDRVRVRELAPANVQMAFLEDLPLNYDTTTLDTIEQIDILWLKGRSIVRAFEVEHTTAVYSGLLRMADLLALQPNMDIRLHIVAPDERREKVFREMRRPVFSLLDRGPLSRSCTFIAYDSVLAIRNLGHLAHTNDSIIAEFEEPA